MDCIDHIRLFFVGHPTLTILLLTWLGAVMGHILSLYDREFMGTTSFMKRVLPGKKDSFYERVDFIMLPFIGCLLAFFLLDPSNIKSAIFSGLTWSGTLLIVFKRRKK